MKTKEQLTDLRALSPEELKTKINDLKHELFNLRFQHSTNQLDNPMKLDECKKHIARAKTVLKEKESAL